MSDPVARASTLQTLSRVIDARDREIGILREQVKGFEAAWRNACERGDKAVARLADVDSALGAWGRNEASDAETIIRIAKAVGATDSAPKGITPDRENERE